MVCPPPLDCTLQKYNDQIKGELNRYRKKSQDFDADITRVSVFNLNSILSFVVKLFVADLFNQPLLY